MTLVGVLFGAKVIYSEQTAEYIFIQSTFSLIIFWYSESIYI